MTYNPKNEYEYYIQKPTNDYYKKDMLYSMLVLDYYQKNPLKMQWYENKSAKGLSSIEVLRLRSPEEQFELDCAMWYGTLVKGDAEEIAFLKRVFTVLFYGGLLYQEEPGKWNEWVKSGIPIASVLSHGGRFVIQLPKATKEEDDDFFNWLGGGTDQNNIILKNQRLAATHGIDPLTYAQMKPMILGRIHRINEGKKDHGEKHYGINISLGGQGNIHPVSTNKIMNNGEHGHIYVYYLRPTFDTYGGLLIGCEGSAGIDAWEGSKYFKTHGHRVPSSGGLAKTVLKNLDFGIEAGSAYVRDKVKKDPSGFTPDQTGGYHKFGDRQEFGATGGKKWDKVGKGPSVVYNGMIVDLSDGWDSLKNKDFQPDNLGKSGFPVVPISRMAPLQIFTKTCMTYNNLQQMKTISTTIDQDSAQLAKGKMPVNKLDVNAIKKKKVWLGLKEKKIYRPKTTEELNPTISSITRNIEPTGMEPFTIEEWKSFSSVKIGSRKSIVKVDNALKDYIDSTSKSMKIFRVRATVDPPTAMDGLLCERIFFADNLLKEILSYHKEKGGKGDRIAATNALRNLMLSELKKLKDARKKLPDYARVAQSLLKMKNIF
ncbi:MAG: hypothetical protein R2941_00960 [Desulfobacterales bacterium]